MIVNQPHDEQLGIQLIKAIESNQFNQLTIMVIAVAVAEQTKGFISRKNGSFASGNAEAFLYL